MQENLLLPLTDSLGNPLPFQTSPPRRILVVDPDPFMCHLSADLLIQQGYEVNATEDGARGWEELQTNDYNLLITGHTPPRLNGVKLVQKVREVRPALPVVMVARKLPAREKVQHPSLHVVAMLFRPVALDAVLRTVKIVLSRTSGVRVEISAPSKPPPQPPVAGGPLPQVAAPANILKQRLRELHQRLGERTYSGLND